MVAKTTTTELLERKLFESSERLSKQMLAAFLKVPAVRGLLSSAFAEHF